MPIEGLTLIIDTGKWWQDTHGIAAAARRPMPSGKRPWHGRDRGRESASQAKHPVRLGHRDEALEYALQYGRDLDHARPTDSLACT